MAETYAFMGDHPILAFFLAALVCQSIVGLFRRATSLLRVALRGWPPAHLDADGDWKPEGDA